MRQALDREGVVTVMERKFTSVDRYQSPEQFASHSMQSRDPLTTKQFALIETSSLIGLLTRTGGDPELHQDNHTRPA